MWQGVMSEEIIQLDTEDSQLLFKPSSKLLQLIVCDLAWASLPKSDPRFNWQIRDALQQYDGPGRFLRARSCEIRLHKPLLTGPEPIGGVSFCRRKAY